MNRVGIEKINLYGCSLCLDQARLARDLEEPLKENPALDQEEFAAKWVAEHPEGKIACLARS